MNSTGTYRNIQKLQTRPNLTEHLLDGINYSILAFRISRRRFRSAFNENMYQDKSSIRDTSCDAHLPEAVMSHDA